MTNFKDIIQNKKTALKEQSTPIMADLAIQAAKVWTQEQALDQVLQGGIKDLAFCHMIYAVNTDGILLSSNVERDQMDSQWKGRDLTGRPYLRDAHPYQGYSMTSVYTSRHTLHPCITVIQSVHHNEKILGFIAADYNLDSLPGEKAQTSPDNHWVQYKGDPAIRGTVFMQQREISAMDEVLGDTIEILTDMMQHHGIFHCKIHFSSSRLSMWSVDDPFGYNIHTLEDITNPERCLAYPIRPQHERTCVSEEDIGLVLDLLKKLRHADEIIYLRSASFNIINGMVGLTFSCDGSHYIPYDEFLNMGSEFWF
ncbi:MAG: hypothetical protein GXP22_05945 [Gammaproteobacteria bacterium]|nr:hypothetical protein [Gammaproteobacteria bacterium]